MINIDVEIKNFGKIKHAKCQVKPFTVIAGKNASGKSFITRALYTIFSSLNKDHLSIEVDSSISQINLLFSIINSLVDKPSLKVTDYIDEMRLASDRLIKNIDQVFHQGTFASQVTYKDSVNADIQHLKKACYRLRDVIASIKKYNKLFVQLESIQLQIKKLENLVKVPHESLSKALGQQLDQAFIGNFQVNTINKLKNKDALETEAISFDFGENIGYLKLELGHLQFNLKATGVDAFQKIDNVVYLESPIYWKIKDVLKGWVQARNDPYLRRRVKHQQKELKKVPDYILDTFELLDTEIVRGEPSDELMQLKQEIDNNIGGHIQVSESGDLQFINQNKSGDRYAVDLHQTATGAISLGIISLLLDKNIVVPNSVLIFDEPEVNLHPAWQQVMIQVLYKLSVAGVRIIMASHSFDMIEGIEKMMDLHEKNGSDVNEHFSILQLENGISINENKPIFKKLDSVKADLGMPLFNLFADQ